MAKADPTTPNAGAAALRDYQGDRASLKRDRSRYAAQSEELHAPGTPNIGAPPEPPKFDPSKMKYTTQEWKKAGLAALIVGMVGTLLYKGNGYLAGAMFSGAMKSLVLGDHQKAQEYLNAYHSQLQAAKLKQDSYWQRYSAILANEKLDFEATVQRLKSLAAEMGADVDLAHLDAGLYGAYQEGMLRRQEAVTRAAQHAESARDHTVQQWVDAIHEQRTRVRSQLATAEAAYKQWSATPREGTQDIYPVPLVKALETRHLLEPSGDFFKQEGDWSKPLDPNEAQKRAHEETHYIDQWFNAGRALSVSINLLRALDAQLDLAAGHTRMTSAQPLQIHTETLEPIASKPPKGQKPAPKSYTEGLLDHPEWAQSFYDHFGYLPSAFLKKYAPEPVASD